MDAEFPTYREGRTHIILPIHLEAKIGGVRYIKLECNCPICFERGKSTELSYWCHGDHNCGGRIYIGDNGHLICGKCGEHLHITQCGFYCPTHSAQSENDEAFPVTKKKRISFQGDYNIVVEGAMSIAAVITRARALIQYARLEWLRELLHNLTE